MLNQYGHSRDFINKANFTASERITEGISIRECLQAIEQQAGLSEMDFLNRFYKEKFVELSEQTYSWEQEKIKSLTSILGLVFERFYSIAIPVPENLLSEIGPKTYDLKDISGWQYQPLSDWCRKFEQYSKQLKEFGKIDMDSKLEFFGLRHELKIEFTKSFFTKIETLLSQDLKKSSAVEVLESNQSLRKLVAEVDGYSHELQGQLLEDFKAKHEKKLKSKNKLADLALKALHKILYSGEFNPEAFHKKMIAYYCDELKKAVVNKSLSDADKLKIVEIISGEMDAILEIICA